MATLRPSALITDFTGGEISPRWHSRVQGGGYDPLQGGGSVSDRYRSGCKELTNMVVLPQGGVAKRQALFTARDLTDDIPEGADISLCRVLKYEAPGSDFLVVLSHNWLGVYATDNLGIGTIASPVFTAITPYTESVVADVIETQYQDALILFYEGRRPRALRRVNGTWSFVDTSTMNFAAPQYHFNDSLSPPSVSAKFNVQFTDDVTREYRTHVSGLPTNYKWAPKFTIVNGDTATSVANLTAALMAMPTELVTSSVVVTHVGASVSDMEFEVEYEYNGAIGDGTGRLTISQGISYPASSSSFLWEISTITDGSGGGEPLWSGPIYATNGGNYYRCLLPHRSAAATEPGVGASWATYWALLGSSLPTTADYSTMPTGEAWVTDSVYAVGNRGWPTAATVHEQRVVANGPAAARAVLAGSRIGQNQFLNFTLGADDDDGFLFVLAVENGASVTWLHSQKLLFVGTSVGLFVQSAAPLTPTNVNFDQQSNYTLGTLPGFNVAGEVFYVQRNERQIRRVQYVDALQSWQATDLTSPVEHWFYRRAFGCENVCRTVKRVAYHNSPDSVLWVLRNDGCLMSLTYERFYDVAGWAKHSTRHGTVTDIASFFGGTPGIDGVAALVVRESDAGSFLTLEVIPETSRNEFTVLFDEDGEWDYAPSPVGDWPSYLDSAIEVTGDGTAVIATPDRFEGLEVDVVEDGIHLGAFTATDNEIVLPGDTTLGARVFVGFRYKSRIRPVKFEGGAGYTSQADKVRWVRPSLRLFNSHIPRVNGQLPRERAAQSDDYDTATGLFTGDIELVNLGFDGELVIESDVPLPLQVTGVFGTMNMEGR